MDSVAPGTLARDDVDFLAGSHESVRNLPGYAFDAAPGLEALDHEGDAHAARATDLRLSASREESDGRGCGAKAGGLRERRRRAAGAARRRAVAAQPSLMNLAARLWLATREAG
jgi:hypothetical protein